MHARLLKDTLKQIMPNALMQQNRRLKRYLRETHDAQLSRTDVFSQIYEQNLWGGARGEFYSGEGSCHKDNENYCRYVSRFIRAHNIRKVVDLGCGDFGVSRAIVDPSFDYVGVDVAPMLVAHNNKQFARKHVRFDCLDMVSDPLPSGDLALVREVLQHLSNDEIKAVLRKVEQYPYVLISEYQPSERWLDRPNIDKAHGMDTRIWSNSGVFLDCAPFNLTSAQVVQEIQVKKSQVHPGERIVTYLLGNR